MTPAQRKIARHALGLPNERMRSYRNRYFAGTRHPAYRNLMGMVHAGLAWREPRNGSSGHLFWLTVEGAQAAIDAGETLCPEDFPPAKSVTSGSGNG